MLTPSRLEGEACVIIERTAPGTTRPRLAILDDAGRMVVQHEAKRDTARLETIRMNVERRYANAAPDMTHNQGQGTRRASPSRCEQ
jgi:hypothetical protein